MRYKDKQLIEKTICSGSVTYNNDNLKDEITRIKL